MPLTSGTPFDSLVLESELSQGATSWVWSATDQQQRVAVKIYRPHLFEHGSRHREARIQQELQTGNWQHSSLIRLHRWGKCTVDNDKYRFVVMDLVEGENLESVVKRDGPLPFDVFKGLALQLLSAVVTLHSNNVIHRDIKPANVILTRSTSIPVLVDFGVATADYVDLASTATHDFLGTPHYSSPEWLFRDPPEAANSPGIDIYGLGATFYELLSGERPYAQLRNLAQLMTAVRTRSIHLSHPGLPVPLSTLLRLMMAKSPDQRPSLAHATEILLGIDSHSAQTVSPQSEVDSLYARLSSNTEVIEASEARSASRKRDERIAAFQQSVSMRFQRFDAQHPLSRLPGVLGVSLINDPDWNVRGHANVAQFLEMFPDSRWSHAFGARVDTIPVVNSASVVYMFSGSGDFYEVVRFMTQGGVTPLIYLDTVTTWSFPDGPLPKTFQRDGENMASYLGVALSRANPE